MRRLRDVGTVTVHFMPGVPFSAADLARVAALPGLPEDHYATESDESVPDPRGGTPTDE